MPTIRRCCIIGCISNSRQNPQLQFFQFPRPENPFHSLWKQACHASLSRILPFKKPVVCALHFHPTNIGGRRLISNAVPSMRLEVPTNLKAVEQQAMVEEIERSRKCAYINAVVYEWLVRANLNPQLRGSITHGMIKEKAETAKQVIGAPSFLADNRWLNRFRESHLTGFAHKLATNQLRPSGPSLWIPDIVQDLHHLFPPTSADRTINFENVPEQYYDYMQQQYGEYEDDGEDLPSPQHSQHSQQPSPHQMQHSQQPSPHQMQHSQQPSPHMQQQPQHHQPPHHMQTSPPQDGYEQHNYNYDDFYYERQHNTEEYPNMQQRPPSHTTPQQQQNPQQRAKSQSPYPTAIKRPRVEDDDEVTVVNGATDQIQDLTQGDAEPEPEKAKTPNGNSTPTNGHSSSPSPKITNGNGNGHHIPASNASNGHTTPAPQSDVLKNYAQALEYLRPLEDFALFKENFRAIGLISQLEVILRKGARMTRNEE